MYNQKYILPKDRITVQKTNSYRPGNFSESQNPYKIHNYEDRIEDIRKEVTNQNKINLDLERQRNYESAKSEINSLLSNDALMNSKIKQVKNKVYTYNPNILLKNVESTTTPQKNLLQQLQSNQRQRNEQIISNLTKPKLMMKQEIQFIINQKEKEYEKLKKQYLSIKQKTIIQKNQLHFQITQKQVQIQKLKKSISSIKTDLNNKQNEFKEYISNNQHYKKQFQFLKKENQRLKNILNTQFLDNKIYDQKVESKDQIRKNAYKLNPQQSQLQEKRSISTGNYIKSRFNIDNKEQQNKQFKDIEEKAKKLKQKQNSLKQKLIQATNQINKLQTELIPSLKSQNQNLKINIISLESKNTSLKTQNEQISYQIQKIKNIPKINVQTMTTYENQEKLFSLQKKNSKTPFTKQIKEQTQTSLMNNSVLTQKNDQLRQQIDQLKKQNQKWKTQFYAVNQSHNLQVKLTEELKRNIKTIQQQSSIKTQQLSNSQNFLKQLDTQIYTLKIANQNLLGEVNNIKQQKQNYQIKSNELSFKNQSISKQLSNLNYQFKILQDNYNNVLKDQQEHKKKFDIKQEELVQEIQLIKLLNIESIKLKEQLLELKFDNESKQSEIKRFKLEIEQKESQIIQQKKKNEELQVKLSKLENARKQLQDNQVEINKMRQYVMINAIQQQKLNSKTIKIQELKEQIGTLESAIQQKDMYYRQLLKKIDDDNQQKVHQYKQMKQEIQKLEKKIQQYESANTEFLKNRLINQQIIQSYKIQKQKIDRELPVIHLSYKNQIQQLKQTINTLHLQFDEDMKKTKTQLQRYINLVQNERDQVIQKLDKKNQECQKYQYYNNQLENTLRNTLQNALKLQQRCHMADKINRQLGLRIQQLKNSIIILQREQQKKQLLKQKQQLEMKNKKLEEELNDSRSKIEQQNIVIQVLNNQKQVIIKDSYKTSQFYINQIKNNQNIISKINNQLQNQINKSHLHNQSVISNINDIKIVSKEVENILIKSSMYQRHQLYNKTQNLTDKNNELSANILNLKFLAAQTSKMVETILFDKKQYLQKSFQLQQENKKIKDNLNHYKQLVQQNRLKIQKLEQEKAEILTKSILLDQQNNHYKSIILTKDENIKKLQIQNSKIANQSLSFSLDRQNKQIKRNMEQYFQKDNKVSHSNNTDSQILNNMTINLEIQNEKLYQNIKNFESVKNLQAGIKQIDFFQNQIENKNRQIAELNEQKITLQKEKQSKDKISELTINKLQEQISLQKNTLNVFQIKLHKFQQLIAQNQNLRGKINEEYQQKQSLLLKVDSLSKQMTNREDLVKKYINQIQCLKEIIQIKNQELHNLNQTNIYNYNFQQLEIQKLKQTNQKLKLEKELYILSFQTEKETLLSQLEKQKILYDAQQKILSERQEINKISPVEQQKISYMKKIKHSDIVSESEYKSNKLNDGILEDSKTIKDESKNDNGKYSQILEKEQYCASQGQLTNLKLEIQKFVQFSEYKQSFPEIKSNEQIQNNSIKNEPVLQQQEVQTIECYMNIIHLKNSYEQILDNIIISLRFIESNLYLDPQNQKFVTELIKKLVNRTFIFTKLDMTHQEQKIESSIEFSIQKQKQRQKGMQQVLDQIEFQIPSSSKLCKKSYPSFIEDFAEKNDFRFIFNNEMQELVKKYFNIQKNQLASHLLQFLNKLYFYPNHNELRDISEIFIKQMHQYDLKQNKRFQNLQGAIGEYLNKAHVVFQKNISEVSISQCHESQPFIHSQQNLISGLEFSRQKYQHKLSEINKSEKSSNKSHKRQQSIINQQQSDLQAIIKQQEDDEVFQIKKNQNIRNSKLAQSEIGYNPIMNSSISQSGRSLKGETMKNALQEKMKAAKIKAQHKSMFRRDPQK